ncbi:hypothetical protein Pst134EB_002089 [Puccinia striiformis f. sp. tritici]|nr:hypothetical protein Pst134EB_002089 [Puccinia striiformis f. sp. tritici]
MPVGYVTDSDDDTDQLEGEGSDNEQEDEIIPGALRSAHCRVWSTWELYERMKENSIDINPPLSARRCLDKSCSIRLDRFYFEK